MSNSPSSKALLILAMIGSMGIGALAYYVKAEPGAAKVPAVSAPADPQPTLTIRSHPRKHYRAPADDTNQVSAEVYVPEITGPNAKLGSASTEVPSGVDPMMFVADKCLKEANVDDVKILSVDVNNGVAVLNFDKQIDSGMGSEQEASFLKALQVSFGQFANIRSIQIEKDNEPVDTLGSIDVSKPLNVVRGDEPASRSSKSVEP